MAKKKQKPKPQKKKNKGKPKPKPKARPKSRHGTAPSARKQAADDTKGPVKAIHGLPQFESQVLASDKPVIVDFWAEWCGPCKAMSPLFEEYAEMHSDDIMFAKVDTESSGDIAEAFNIRSLPTFLAFHKGEVIDQKVGVVMPVALEKWIDRLKKKTGVTKDAPPPVTPVTTKAAEAPEESLSFGQKIRRFFGGK